MNNTFNKIRLQYLHKPQNARGWGQVTFWHESVLLVSRRERAEASDRKPCKLESRKSPKYPTSIPWKASLMEWGHSISGRLPGASGESEGAGWPGQSTPGWHKTIRAPFHGGGTGESGIKIKQDRDKSGQKKKKKIQGRKGEGELGEQNGKSDKGSQAHLFFNTMWKEQKREMVKLERPPWTTFSSESSRIPILCKNEQKKGIKVKYYKNFFTKKEKYQNSIPTDKESMPRKHIQRTFQILQSFI